MATSSHHMLSGNNTVHDIALNICLKFVGRSLKFAEPSNLLSHPICWAWDPTTNFPTRSCFTDPLRMESDLEGYQLIEWTPAHDSQSHSRGGSYDCQIGVKHFLTTEWMLKDVWICIIGNIVFTVRGFFFLSNMLVHRPAPHQPILSYIHTYDGYFYFLFFLLVYDFW